MTKPVIIMATSNGIGAGHLIRSSAIANEMKSFAQPILFSMANSALEVAESLDLECEYVPGRDRNWMPRWRWDRYLRDRLVALIDETGAKVVTFDGVVPYPGILAAKFKRPQVSYVWIRRGMWRTQPQGIALNLQSKLIDYIIEPGDLARDYDNGPTKDRDDAVVTSPVTLFDHSHLMSRGNARKVLNLDVKKLTVLVQLGVGENDMNERVSLILKTLSHTSNIQVVMTRAPIDKVGNSLSPRKLDLKIVRYFPLSEVLSAFDAIICASGYNSVHEVIPAGVPTLFVPNSRGTDDQQARAKWCADSGLALFADESDLADLEGKVKALLEFKTRKQLKANCRKVKNMNGRREIAEILRTLLNENVTSLVLKRIRHKRILAQSTFERGFSDLARRIVNWSLRLAALTFRFLFPHHTLGRGVSKSQVVFATNKKRSVDLLKKGLRLEHYLIGSSRNYLNVRTKIAQKSYQLPISQFRTNFYSGTFESISLNSATKSA